MVNIALVVFDVLKFKGILFVVPTKLLLVALELPANNHALELMADDISNPDEATPFTVEVKVVPLNAKAFELIIFTPAPVTPFTVVVNVLVDEVLLTPLIAFDVAAIPFTVEVSVFVASDKVLVVVPVWFDQLNTPAPFVVNCCPLVPS